VRIEDLSLVGDLELPKNGVIIVDEKLLQYYEEVFRGSDLPILKLKAGEEHKSYDSVSKVYDFLTKYNATRFDSVHVFGGGTILDVAAYAGSTFKRGLKLWLYPSTLLAMVDAAIGGKTGYNYLQHKNLIGSFYHAERIQIYPGFLDTLPMAERRQGLAEMLKLYFIVPTLKKPVFAEDLMPSSELILLYAKAKMRICIKDPHDHGLRQHLNLGHSFGHALESSSGYKIAHGDAVIWGIGQAAAMSLSLNLIDANTYSKIQKVLQAYPMPEDVLQQINQIDPNTLFKYMQQDKKNTQKLNLILFVGYRKVDIVPINKELLV